MSRWSARRAQVYPLPALVAVVAVGLAVTLYAGVLAAERPHARGDATPDVVLESVVEELSVAGVVLPDRLERGTGATPAGSSLNVTLAVGGRRWHRGPAPPTDAPTASRRVPLRLAPGRVRPARLSVVVWS